MFTDELFLIIFLVKNSNLIKTLKFLRQKFLLKLGMTFKCLEGQKKPS